MVGYYNIIYHEIFIDSCCLPNPDKSNSEPDSCHDVLPVQCCELPILFVHQRVRALQHKLHITNQQFNIGVLLPASKLLGGQLHTLLPE